MTTSQPVRCAIYTRISDDPEGKQLGVQDQRTQCETRAAREGWQVVHVYEENDTGASAHSKKARPEYAAMLAAARAGNFDVILSYSNSRLTRRMLELEELVTLNKETGVQLRTVVSGDDNLATADGLMVARIKASVDAAEAHRISERVSNRLGSNAALGKPRRSNWRPFGWTDNSMQELHPEEAPLIQQAAADLLTDASVRGLVVKWNQAGIRTTSGNTWQRMTFKQMMSRWTNAAIPTRHDEPLFDVEGQWAPILDRQTLEAVRAVTAPGGVQKTAARTALLSGILRCGRCGKTMVSHSGRYSCSDIMNGLCSVTITPHLVENRIIAWTLIQVYAKAQEMLKDQSAAAERARVAVELAQLQEERKQIAESGLDITSRIALLKDVERREKDAQQESVTMVRQSVLGSLIADLAPMNTIQGVDDLDTLRERWESLDFQQKRLLLRSFGEFRIAAGGRGAGRLEILPAEPS